MFKRRRTVEANTRSKSPAGARFRSVSIIVRAPCCNEARRLSGARFLVEDAPELPLPGCNVVQCRCRFRQHEDRRNDARRSLDVGITSSFYVGPERRSGIERRREPDDESDPSYFDYFRQ